MKKLFTFMAAALMTVAASAQDGTLPDTLYTHPATGYVLSDTTVIGKFIEYNDSVVLDNFDGNGAHMRFTWESGDYDKINGEANPYIYFKDATYYCGYMYPKKYTGGKWNHTNGGYFYTYGYMYSTTAKSSNWYMDFILMTAAQKDAYVLSCRMQAMKALKVAAEKVYNTDVTSMADYITAGWAMMEDPTAAPTEIKKKTTIDPATDGTVKAANVNGTDVKDGNAKKIVYMKITNATEAKFYLTSEKISERRATVINITTKDTLNSAAITKDEGVTIDIPNLDPTKEYTFKIVGATAATGAGADVDFFATKFYAAKNAADVVGDYQLTAKIEGKQNGTAHSNTFENQTVKVASASDSEVSVTLPAATWGSYSMNETVISNVFVGKTAAGSYTLSGQATININDEKYNCTISDESSISADKKTINVVVNYYKDANNYFTVTYTIYNPTALKNVAAASKATSGKFAKNGQIVILKNGKQYNAVGAQMK